jgi:hypothetical protein
MLPQQSIPEVLLLKPSCCPVAWVLLPMVLGVRDHKVVVILDGCCTLRINF